MQRDDLSRAYLHVRALTERLVEPLAIEDYVVQPTPDVSPAKWHLAHTTWFFETLVVHPHAGPHRLDTTTQYLFNSYYQSLGERVPQAERGHFSRPTVAEVRDYRRRVDAEVLALIAAASDDVLARLAPVLVIGLNHEQQHQELLVTDIKRALFQDPLFPAYAPAARFADLAPAGPRPGSAEFVRFDAAMTRVGHGGEGFAFDNELPEHATYVNAYQLGRALVTQGDYLEFVRDGGYARPDLWLSEGWATVQARGWKAPLYWLERDGAWHAHTMYGLQPLVAEHPVSHVSYYEANAYAAWKRARLPTEAEWEHAARATGAMDEPGTLLDAMALHPVGRASSRAVGNMVGDVWEWTQSAYLPHPGYRRPDGALGEYNGKFMIGQMVLKGGSCATPEDHVRLAYRNFFQPDKRWQFTGIRLARDA